MSNVKMGSFEIPAKLEKWEEAYNDWRDLLERAGAEDLAMDPKAVWDEAWRQVTMISLSVIRYELTARDVKKVEDSLKKKLVG